MSLGLRKNVELFMRRTELSELSLWEVRGFAYALINQRLKKEAKGIVKNVVTEYQNSYPQ